MSKGLSLSSVGAGRGHAGEGQRAFLMLLNVFLILVAYYIIKTVREPLILGTEVGQQRCENSWRAAATGASETSPQIAISLITRGSAASAPASALIDRKTGTAM